MMWWISPSTEVETSEDLGFHCCDLTSIGFQVPRLAIGLWFHGASSQYSTVDFCPPVGNSVGLSKSFCCLCCSLIISLFIVNIMRASLYRHWTIILYVYCFSKLCAEGDLRAWVNFWSCTDKLVHPFDVFICLLIFYTRLHSSPENMHTCEYAGLREILMYVCPIIRMNNTHQPCSYSALTVVAVMQQMQKLQTF